MSTAITAAAITIGGTLLAGKIAANRHKEVEPKAQIGSGTAPQLTPGPATEFAPIEGSELASVGEFNYDDPYSPSGIDPSTNDILKLLMSSGIDPSTLNERGVAGLAIGGALKAAKGGELNLQELLSQGGKRPEPFQNLQELDDFLDFTEGNELNLQELLSKMGGFGTSLMPSQKEGILSLIPSSDNEETSLVELDADGISLVDSNQKIAPVAMYNSTSNNPIFAINKNSMKEETLAGLDNTINPTLMDRFSSTAAPAINYANENPEMFKAYANAGFSVLQALLDKPREVEQKGSLVRTKTLPTGGLGAKRDYLRQMTPIQGSTFAADGGALNRRMFKPMLEGGDIEGPGGPKDDVIPVMASNGEFMLSNAAVKHMGKGNHDKGIAMLEQFNKQGNKRYG
tara:strand:- start:1507 stop:2706 length:1200 start_codon:yes stop_codon:yes gene_type:complete